MSWQLGAFAILFVALAGGFGWYERSRPDARIVALVATLAAFAALGRIAFAAVPNVKPTTDIVLVSGYALGGAPGFVVGATAALISNFFFGQGPWTPWQMVGWGATGLIGAGLALVARRQIGRWPLAMVCAVVGFAFTALQDFGDWVTYSDHSAAQLGVYVGRGIAFDAVHAAGCFVFALAFGLGLARSIARFAARLQVTWRRAGEVIVPVLLVALLGLVVATRPGAARAVVARTPIAYLLRAQNADGGFGGAPGQRSDQSFSSWTALGLTAEGESPRALSRGGNSLIAYLRRGAGSLADPGSLERTILAVAASGLQPANFGGRDLVAALERQIGRDGSISDQTNLTAFALLALRAAGRVPPAGTVAWLIRQEDRDGGFNFATAGAASDVDDTGAVLEALAGTPAGRVRPRAVGFIEGQQASDGGFPSGAGGGSNAQSTAWAVQGLIAAGVNPTGLHRAGAPSPLRYMSSLIAPDGHVRYSRSSDQTPVWVTAQAVMALAGKSLPLAPLSAQPAVSGRAPSGSSRRALSRSRRRPRATARHARPGGLHAREGASLTLKLATDAGVIEALALAPIGLG
jgi:energy-coupling factor transport system substrate-specific component